MQLLLEAVNSVLQQSYKNYEVIIVNDYPTQREEINKLFANNGSVKVIHHEISRGGNVARNTGLNNATGDIIAFLDDDDTWSSNKLEIHSEEHKKYPKAGLIYSNCKYFWEGTNKIQFSSGTIPDDILKAMGNGEFCPPTTSAVSVKKSCFDQCGNFDNELISFQDWDMWFRIAQKYSLVKTDQCLVNFRQHSGVRTSKDITKRLTGLEQITKKWSTIVNLENFVKKHRSLAFYYNVRSLIDSKKYKTALFNSVYILNIESPTLFSMNLFVKANLYNIKNLISKV